MRGGPGSLYSFFSPKYGLHSSRAQGVRIEQSNFCPLRPAPWTLSLAAKRPANTAHPFLRSVFRHLSSVVYPSFRVSGIFFIAGTLRWGNRGAHERIYTYARAFRIAFDYAGGILWCASSLAGNALRLKGRLGQRVPAASEDTPHPRSTPHFSLLTFSFEP